MADVQRLLSAALNAVLAQDDFERKARDGNVPVERALLAKRERDATLHGLRNVLAEQGDYQAACESAGHEPMPTA